MSSSFDLYAKKSSSPNTVTRSYLKEDILSDKNKFKFHYYFSEALCKKEAGDLASAADLLYRCHLIHPQSAVVFFELATLSSQQQQYASALKYVQRAVKLNSENLRYKRAYAELASRSDNYDLAIEQYTELLVIDKKHADSYYPVLASLYAMTKQYEKACDALDQYASLTKLTPEITEEKFKLYVKAGDKKKAFEQLDELVEKYPDNFNYISFKASMYNSLSDSVSAAKTFQQAFKKNPNKPALQYVYAKYAEDLGKYDEASTYYNATVNNPNATFDLKSGSILSAAMDSMISMHDSVYTRFITEYPDEYLPYFCYGVKLLSLNDTTCYSYFKKSLLLNPEQEETWSQLTTFYSQQSNVDSTASICQKALIHFPDNVDFHYLLGFSMKTKKQDSLAIPELKKAIQLSLNQQNPVVASSIYGTLGDYYHELGKNKDAYAAYDSALYYDESNIMVMNNYAFYLCEEKQDLQKAERLSGKTIKASPQNPIYLDTYAWICFKRGEYTMAQLYIEQAINHGGDKYADVWEHYGDILYKLREPKEIYLKQWKKALELHEKEKDASQTLAKLKLKIEKETYVE